MRLDNDRGSVLCAAVFNERIRPGIVHTFTSSARYDPIEPRDPRSPDPGGCVALLTPVTVATESYGDFEFHGLDSNVAYGLDAAAHDIGRTPRRFPPGSDVVVGTIALERQ